MKESEINKEDISSEENLLKQIISSAELVLDDLYQGGSFSQSSYNLLGYADGIMLRIQKDVNENSKPSNIKGGNYSSDGSFAPMTDRIYCDDEHGNAL